VPRSRFSLFFISFFTLGVLAFLSLPVARLYVASGVLSAQQLETIFFSPLARALFLNTFLLCASTAVLAVLFGAPVAFAASRGIKILRPPTLLLCALPLALPPTLMASAYLEYSRTPPATSMASLAAEHAIPINAVFVAAPVLALCFFPIPAFTIWAALQNFPSEWEDAAWLFGNPFSAWTRVLAPLLWPAILGAAGIVAALAMWEMGAPDLLDVRTYSVQIYRAFAAGGDSSFAARAAFPMFFLGALFFVPAWRALKFYKSERREAIGFHPTRRGRNFPITIIALLILMMSPLAPLAVFCAQANPLSVFAEVWDANRNEIINTLLVPATAAASILVLALALVLLWREYSPRAQRHVLAICLAPLLCAPILLAVALIDFYNRDLFTFVYDSRYGLLLIGFIARFLPLAVLWLHEAARRVPNALEEAAQSLGASKPRIAWTILVPLLAAPSIAVVAILFALCAGELSLAVLLNAPGGQTLPVPIFNQMHIGATENVAALSLTLAALSGGVLLSLLGLWAKLQQS
jgi:iron(III) transport system permease protein